MNKLSKEKRNQLVLVCVLTLIVMAGLYFGVISNQQRSLRKLAADQDKAKNQLNQVSNTIKSSAKIEADLAAVNKTLGAHEANMASEDGYLWMVQFLRKFNENSPVEIRQYNSKGAAAMDMFPKFPYKQFTVSITGSAYYYDLGKFIADFENRYPSVRVMNLELAPDSAVGPLEKGKLAFKMDIVSLVKSNGTQPSAKKP
jgi:Tfp pilus assembly protein PilO